jgi:hypothetical protein
MIGGMGIARAQINESTRAKMQGVRASPRDGLNIDTKFFNLAIM